MTDRFARHAGLPGWRQDLLGDATAVVCGAGALGNEVAKNLGMAGIGRLIICDPDTVSRSNLSRTVLFREKDVGRPKVEAAAEALAGLAPQCAVQPRAAGLTAGVGLAELRDSSIVLGCLDSRRARLELLGRCALADARLVDGGTGPWSGEVRMRVDAAEPCYGCTLTARERAVGDLPTAYTDLYPEREMAASIALTALVGAWMTTAALQIVFGQPPDYRMLRIEGLTGTTGPVAPRLAPDCPHHRPLGPVDLRVPISPDDTVEDLLSHLPDGYTLNVWAAFPVRTTCSVRDGQTRYHRAANGTQRRHCMQCGAVIRPASSYRLSDADRSDRLSGLGVAPGEILPARGPDGAVLLVELGSGRDAES
ncbi:HesA/MoeB/ThiF family protein [Actinoplanes derwentensis]|uniref:Molybdopterin or thiamine biosynthesis adenylyltransferase n=1 Tax=Actinoplanes derwentensis TaxID=113562 RepID=A0A1H2AI66_9ACTN|nr:ThiF family adenylyltransferase [Actinoplanes derwentensis]GID90305.1 hypothetical protein Ade03nite_92290 [Actinoplanes derwentensis]SDT45695.1 Molybdopterin or thiamine biosynthesis adenylyltransferase [Actinoplanes derwentensis]